MKRRGRSFSGLAVLAAVLALTLAAGAQTVIEARASTLATPLDQIGHSLSAWHFAPQTAGSRFLLRRLTDLHAPMDLLAVADASLFSTLASTDSGAPVQWWLEFAGDEMVLAYTPRSHDASSLTAANWMDVLLRPGVSWGYADPNLDPEGYNTLLAWKLAERYYHRPGLFTRLRTVKSGRRPQSVELAALLTAGELDYAWQYLSVARRLGLRYLRLPAAVNLGDPSRAAEYAKVRVPLAGATPGSHVTRVGAPIAFAITIPTTARHLAGASAFLRQLASPAGEKVLAANFLTPWKPPCIGGTVAQAPAEIQSWLKQFPRCR